MFQLLKKLFTFIWMKKRLWILILFLTVLFFSIRFPWNSLIEKAVKNIQKQSPSHLQTDFDKLQLQFFPPGLEFKNMSFNYKRKALMLDRFRVSIVLSKWLAFKKAWGFKAFHRDSSLSVVFWKQEKTLKDEGLETPVPVYFVKGYSPSLELEVFNDLFSNMKMSGKVQTRLDYEGSPERLEESVAFFSLKGDDIRLSKAELTTRAGPLPFPPMQWSDIELIFHLKEGEVTFKTFRLGSPSDNLTVKMKGSAAVGFSYGRVQLNSYNIQLQIDVDKEFKMNILELMFKGYREDKGGFYRYRLQMTGQGSQAPHMEKLSEF